MPDETKVLGAVLDEMKIQSSSIVYVSTCALCFVLSISYPNWMRILVLDMKNHVTESISRHQGTFNSSVLRTSETYPPAVSPNGPGVLICHNHPSGDPMLLPEDIAVTEQLVAAGQHLDIELVDHLVIGNQRFVSLKERLRW